MPAVSYVRFAVACVKRFKQRLASSSTSQGILFVATTHEQAIVPDPSIVELLEIFRIKQVVTSIPSYPPFFDAEPKRIIGCINYRDRIVLFLLLIPRVAIVSDVSYHVNIVSKSNIYIQHYLQYSVNYRSWVRSTSHEESFT